MGAPAPTRLVGAALRCYPAAWRRRHGEDAAELAAQLIDEGTPIATIVWSYLTWALRERLAPRTRRRRRIAVAAVAALVSSVGLPFVLVTLSPSASASSVVRPCASHRGHASTGTLPGQDVDKTGSQHDRQCESG